jgi:NADPH:quinone reductase-like Zn-dependent oxidoreductase
VLIIGASGGVGTYAVQIATALGGGVTGVASTAKVDLVRSLGAERVVDYTSEDFADGPHQYDLILDIGGNSTLTRLRRTLSGRVAPSLERTYPLEQLPDALRHLRSGTLRGKVAVTL